MAVIFLIAFFRRMSILQSSVYGRKKLQVRVKAIIGRNFMVHYHPKVNVKAWNPDEGISIVTM